MKITILLLFAGIGLLSANTTFGQEKISLNAKNKPLHGVLNDIEERSHYTFFYNDNAVDLDRKVNISVQDYSIDNILSLILDKKTTNYTILDKQIILYSDKKELESIMRTQQRSPIIKGKVVESDGTPIVGVVVNRKGTTTGTITDINGNFSLPNIPVGTMLEFSLIGFVKTEKKYEGQEELIIIMLEDVQALGEVEVVAFGTQKKESVIGSITTIAPKNLRAPTSNLTTALAGQVAGLISYQRSGEPGADNADFFVRGIASFGFNTSPLILIDNIESTSTDLARLNPDDIESFSVMKDATATALYGSRGANGVVLIQTKEGKKGKTKLEVRIETSFSQPTKNIELADPITYMKMHNEAILTRNPEQPTLYSDDKIDRTIPGSGSVIYPYTDWRKELMKSMAWNTRANANISGGGDVARYYVSMRFTKDEGLLKVNGKNNFNNNIDLKTYQLRTNVNIDVTKSTEIKLSLSGIFDDYTGPIYSGTEIYNMVMAANPVLFPAVYPVDNDHQYIKHILFGNYEPGNYINPYAEMVKGYKEYGNTNLQASVTLNQNLNFITEGLKFSGLFNVSRKSYYTQSRQYKPFYYQLGDYNFITGEYNINAINPDGGTEYLDFVPGEKTVNNVMMLETRTTYNRDFGPHAVSGLLVTQYRDSKDPNYTDLQQSLPSRNMGLSGRLTYAFDSRYFTEFNFGYNGSERFDKKHRWGFFPSIGGGWMISNEAFFSPLKKEISKLKLRASYGLVGNDRIGDVDERFLYLSNVNMNAGGGSFGYEYNGYSKDGIRVSRYANPTIGWEKSHKGNYALEIDWRGFEVIAEYFTERRTNILQERTSIPLIMGYEDTPRANLGEAKGKGVDIDLKYNKNITKDLYVIARGSFTYAHNKYTKYEEQVYKNEWWKSHIGYPTKQEWGYIAEGLFIDDAEVANSPTQFGDYKAGDIKYRDMNGDGVINSLDQVPIGYPSSPEINYGFGATFGYKGFDFNFQFQGSARSSFWINYGSVSPFFNTSKISGRVGNTQLAKFIADSYWSELNKDRYAVWPRLSTQSISNNAQKSTWFMRDGAFLRLKLVEAGYTFPEKMTRKIGLSNLRIYASATNLFHFSKFDLWDVEMAGNGLGYPLQRVVNIGLNLAF